MKNATEHAATLKQLLHKLAPQVPPHEPPKRTPVELLIHAFLSWESTHHQADQAYARLMRHVVDINDLRVSDPVEIVVVIGPEYDLAEERAARIKASLNAIYKRQYAVDLSVLESKTKRDVREYLETLEGMTPYVAAVVALFGFHAHAFPVDLQLHKRLAKDGVIDRKATPAETQAFLEHHIHMEDVPQAFYQLRAYVERPIRVELGRGRKTKKTTKKTSKKSTKKTTKKSTKKKSSKSRR